MWKYYGCRRYIMQIIEVPDWYNTKYHKEVDKILNVNKLWNN